MKGNDLRNQAVKDVFILPDSRVMQMVFCFETFAIAEEIYTGVFGRDVDIIGIINDLSEGMTAALQVIVYGAMAVADKSLSFHDFLTGIYRDDQKPFLYTLVVDNVNKMIREGSRNEGSDEDAEFSFPWDDYYKRALAIGLTDADFWASTPRKLWLLTRDKEAEEHQQWLTNTYV